MVAVGHEARLIQGAADPASPVRQRRPLEGERPQAARGWAS